MAGAFQNLPLACLWQKSTTLSEINRNEEHTFRRLNRRACLQHPHKLSDTAAYLNGFSQPFAAGFVMRRERSARRVPLFADASDNIRHALGRSVLRVHDSLQEIALLLPMNLVASSTQTDNEHGGTTTGLCDFDVEFR